MSTGIQEAKDVYDDELTPPFMRGSAGATLLRNSPFWGVADSGFMDMMNVVCEEVVKMCVCGLACKGSFEVCDYRDGIVRMLRTKVFSCMLQSYINHCDAVDTHV